MLGMVQMLLLLGMMMIVMIDLSNLIMNAGS